jgi:hypothetical protein
MEDFNFKSFLLNENKVYLAQEIGDILNSVQELNDEVDKIGTRNLVRYTQVIINKARGILQGHWGDENRKWLTRLQKCAVALAKAIDENDNTEEVLKSVQSEVESMLKKMGVPFNTISPSNQPQQQDKSATTAAVPTQIGGEAPAGQAAPSLEPEPAGQEGMPAPTTGAVNQMPDNLGL